MGMSEILAGLHCEMADAVTEHTVNTVTGEAACNTCAYPQVIDPADLRDLLVDA
jgi:hypothetical protein